jgi:hypothetical protein
MVMLMIVFCYVDDFFCYVVELSFFCVIFMTLKVLHSLCEEVVYLQSTVQWNTMERKMS